MSDNPDFETEGRTRFEGIETIGLYSTGLGLAEKTEGRTRFEGIET